MRTALLCFLYKDFESVLAMASLVSCVGRAASCGHFSSTLRDVQITAGHSKTHIGHRVSRLRRQKVGLGQQDRSLAAFRGRAPRLDSISRKAGGPGGDDDPTKRDPAGVNETKFNDTVEDIQKALAKSFGGPLWFFVLLTLLAVFGGGYVYLIYNYADFADIPILNGPQEL